VDKKPHCTSHDVVAQLRQLLGVRRVGHTGTLDPFATGLLVCCVGRATKLSPYLMELEKTYEGDIRLGVRTDTGDRTGSVVAESAVPDSGVEELQNVAQGFVGEILQTPPMVSAIKHKGRRLYELARMGVSVERTPRSVRVHELTILDRTGPLLHFRVRCGRGTYVRTLVEDFARALGTEGTVDRLTRTRVGTLTVEDAVSQDLVASGDLGAVMKVAIPMADALLQHRGLTLTEAWVRRVRQGTAPPWSVLDLDGPPPSAGEIVRLLGPAGSLIALARVRAVPGPDDRHWADDRELVLQRVL
jgi:tRNA pseudouridine55 synthase